MGFLCMSLISKVGFGNYYSLANNQNSQGSQTQQNEQKQSLINKNYNEIYSHEMAHKTAGGHLAGAIVIEKNGDGIPVGGHVAIKMPSIDPNNPQKTIDEANIVIRSAMAPADPSNQDYRVAAQARSIKSQAQGMLSGDRGKKLNLMA